MLFRASLPLLAVLLFPATLSAQVKMLRHPTYSKGKVAFSYLGDLWIANERTAPKSRSHLLQSFRSHPRFSPDGQSLAFSSNRDGNYDVFVMPITGGKPKQLTFHSADDTAVGWNPDGRKVLFSSARGKGAFPNVATLFEVSTEGGAEQPVPTDWGATSS